MPVPIRPNDSHPHRLGTLRGWWRSLWDAGQGLGTRLTLFVLLAGLGLSGFLLYQTFAAQLSHREAVSHGLENLSVLVADRMMVPVVGDWFMASGRGFRPVLSHPEGAGADPPPHPSELSSGNLIGGNCECLLAPTGAASFRMELASGEIVFGEDGPDSPSAEVLREQLTAAAEIPVSDSTHWRFDVRPAGSLILVDEADEVYAVPFVLLFGPDDQPRWVYGFAVPAQEFLSGSLEALLELAPRLLPREFRSPPEIPVLASAAITTTEGSRVLAQVDTEVAPGAAPGPSTTVAGFQQTSVLDHVRMTVALHPEFLAWIPVARSSDGPTWLYALIFLLNAGLVGVALLQLTWESAFLRRRTEFVAGFSHEARNPLATIRLYVQGLRFGRISDDGARVRALDIIDRESRRLVHMVANFLSYGAHEEGRLRLTPHPVEVTDELRTFASAARSEFRERNAELALETDGPIWVHADPTALQQVVRNLVGNALKYGPPDQTIRLGVETSNGAVQLYVEDEGPGIPEEEREEVFEPFVRTPEAVRSGAGGSGLGLSVVRDLVTLQGGSVHVEPGRVGQGARFVVQLPSGDGRAASPSRPSASGADPPT